jgi:O-antigen ligase
VILVVGTVIAAGLAMKAQDTIAHRFAKAADASWSSRVRANDAVFLMLQDHPAGVGINHFALVNEQGRYEERANGAPVPDWDLIGIVHNIYLLTLAEMGYVGLLAFLALILVPLWTAFRAGWRGSPTLRGELLLGLGVGLLAMSLMGLLEWGWRQTAVAYLYWIAVGLVGVLSRQQAHGTGRSPRVSRPRPESTTPPAGRPLTSSAGRWRPSSPANRR